MVGSAIGILSTGSYVPEREVTNEDLAAWVSVTPDWILRKTNIACRRYAAPGEATSDLATAAARRALAAAGLSPGELGYLVVSTSTGDFPQPPTAYLVQHLLGADEAACLDINVVCSGFVYGMALAWALLTQNPQCYALVVGADLYSRLLDYTDHRTSILLGDGAGAVVMGQVPAGNGIVGVELASRGDASRLVRVEAGGSRRPASAATLAAGEHFFRMDGAGVRDFVLSNVPKNLDDLSARTGVRMDEVDHFVPHQPNGVLLGRLVERIGLPNAKTHTTLERYGNTGSASIPITLDSANRSGELRDGENVLLSGFGGGMSMASCLLRWSVR